MSDRNAEGGWSARRACALLGLDHWRAARWAQRREAGWLENASSGGHPLHGLPGREREAVIELFKAWGGIGRSRRKLAHRGVRIGLVHPPGSTVRRVLGEEGLVIEGPPPQEPVPRSPWPDWMSWKPGSIWACDFTHWTRARRALIAILEVVSRKCLATLATLASPQETSAQAEVAFTAALEAEGLLELADQRATAALREAIASGDRDQMHGLAGGGQVPLLLAISGNGPQMRSVSTREFMAGVAISQQSGCPHTPQDRASIRTLSGHVKGEWPHLEKIRDPGEPGLELDRSASPGRARSSAATA